MIVQYQPGISMQNSPIIVELQSATGYFGMEVIGCSKKLDESGVFISAVHAGTPAASCSQLTRGLQLGIQLYLDSFSKMSF